VSRPAATLAATKICAHTPLRRCRTPATGQARATVPSAPPTIAYLFTTFPKNTETFLQREITGLQALGARLRLYSMWGGGGEFNGQPVRRFPKWKLAALVWMIPLTACRQPLLFVELLRGLRTRRAPSWLNFWENMLGAAFACLHAAEFRRDPPAHTHAVWGGAPATAAWLLWRLNGQIYSAAAHAYDLYDRGGDWCCAKSSRPRGSSAPRLKWAAAPYWRKEWPRKKFASSGAVCSRSRRRGRCARREHRCVCSALRV
jgi:hypothetical protein